METFPETRKILRLEPSKCSELWWNAIECNHFVDRRGGVRKLSGRVPEDCVEAFRKGSGRLCGSFF